MPNYTEAQQRIIDDITRRGREVTEAQRVVQTPTEQRIREREQGRVLRGGVRRTNVVQTPRGSRYIGDVYDSVTAHAVSLTQSRPIHADFESSFSYNLFLNSKYKHHHKCSTCLSVFRCGQKKCDRTLCRLCDLRNELNAQTVAAVPTPWSIGYNTNEVVRLNFNATDSAVWDVDNARNPAAQDSYVTVDEVAQWAARQEYTVDLEAAERRVLAGTSFLADLAPESNTEEES